MLSEALDANRLHNLGILTLASVGDSAYDLMVRSHLCARGVARAGELHRQRVAYVNAKAQARYGGLLEPLLTEEEAAVYRRGRNAQPGNVPDSATREEYQTATALEALLGWLYLSGQLERLRDLFEVITNEHEA